MCLFFFGGGLRCVVSGDLLFFFEKRLNML